MTGFKGVCRTWTRVRGQLKFQAQLKHDGRQKHLGNFATAESSASCPTAKAEARVLLLFAWLTVRDAFADPLPTW